MGATNGSSDGTCCAPRAIQGKAFYNIPYSMILWHLLILHVSHRSTVPYPKERSQADHNRGGVLDYVFSSPVEWRGSTTAGLGRDAVGASAGLEEVQHHR